MLVAMIKGQSTTRVARNLSERFSSRGIDVLYAHGQRGTDPEKQLGLIVCWFGSTYRRDAFLAFPDIAVISRDSDKALVLIEVEETSATPKKLMTDAFTTLIGDHITFQRTRELKLGRWTRLVVLARAGERSEEGLRLELLQERLNEIRRQLSTHNASVQQVVIGTFQDEADLEKKLVREIEKALALSVS
jgi:hypothetical protein